MEEKECRICGCTAEDCSQCIEKTGEPCTWVSEVPPNKHGPLCSACARHCRMCGFDLVADTCSWVPELENEEGGVCLPCVSRFMGGAFQMVRPGQTPAYGNLPPDRPDMLYAVSFSLHRMEAGEAPAGAILQEPEEPEVELTRKCCLVGGPRDGEFFTEILPVTSYAHVGPPMGVYKFKGDHSSDGREVWIWKEHSPK